MAKLAWYATNDIIREMFNCEGNISTPKLLEKGM